MNNIFSMSDAYAGYLRDESGYYGHADAISIPVDVPSFIQTARDLLTSSTPITMQGSKTGITGACVPIRGTIINTCKLNVITGMSCRDNNFYIHADPGVIFSDLEQCLQTRRFDTSTWDDVSLTAYDLFRKSEQSYFLPGPTEKTATIGGSFAAGASGIDATYFGSFPQCVDEISVLLACGKTLNIRRGSYKFTENGCKLPNGEFLPFSLATEHYSTPYLFGHPGMDLIDLFAGSEGMYGIITRLTLRLLPLPIHMWGVACFFSNADQAVCFAEALTSKQYDGATVSAVEFADSASLGYFQNLKENSSKLADIPDIDDPDSSMVYFELISNQPEAEKIEDALFDLLSVLESFGVPEQRTWAASSSHEIERLRNLRHAIPEAINQKKDALRLTNPQVTKISTDFSAPTKHFRKLFQMYTDDIAKNSVPAAIFGHVTDCHLHINFLPETVEQLYCARNLIQKWADKIHELKGNIFTENGIGKIKRNLFSNCLREPECNIAIQTKNYLDPEHLLNPGNCFLEDTL